MKTCSAIGEQGVRSVAALVIALLIGLSCLAAAPAAAQTPQLAGGWRGAYVDPSLGAQVFVELVLQADGRFSQVSYAPATGFMMRLWGRYEVFPTTIRYTFEGFEPRQYCGPTSCTDITIPSGETVQFQQIDANTLMLDGTAFRRVP